MKIAPNVGLADKEIQINTKKKRPHQGVYLCIGLFVYLGFCLV